MKRLIVFVLMAALLLVGCGSGGTSVPAAEGGSSLSAAEPSSSGEADAEEGLRTVTDAAGREVELPAQVESVICVNVGALRFTTYMGATDLVIGVEQNEYDPSVAKLFSYLNRDLFATLPATGDNGTTYDEEIVRLAPDVVVAAVDGDTADGLQDKLEIPVVAVPLVDNMFDDACYDTLALLGEVYGREERAEELTAYIKGLEEDLARRTADIPEEEKPTVYVGGVNFRGAHSLDGTEAGYAPFAAIGAVNLADRSGVQGAFNIDLEQVLQWDPDIIFLDFSGMGLINDDYAENPDFYNALSAVRDGRLYSQIPFRFNAVNAEIALADTYYAGSVIFPQQFADVDPIQKADEIFEMMLGVPCYDLLRDAGYEFRKMTIGE